MKYKIIVDAVTLLSPLTGIGRYTYEISKNLQENQLFECTFFYGYYSKKLIKKNEKVSTKNIISIFAKRTFFKKLLRDLAYIWAKFFSSSYDLYWQPNLIPLEAIKAKKTITTVHDFSFMLYPDFHPKERIQYIQKNFIKNIYTSDMIITGSNYTKEEIIQRLDFPKEKIKVIYHGVDHNVFKVYKDVQLSFEIPQKFILSVGSVEPRKNLLNAFKAYNALDEKIKKEYKLVFVGFKGWNNQEIMKLIDEEKQNIHYLGYISDIELAKVYNRASLFLFPSLYEGFGLPVLEAMACATPVVCSDSSSLPEVGGDAVVYCDADNYTDMSKQIQKVLEDENLQKTMIQKGLKRAKLFSWKKSADAHRKLFTLLLKEL